jgi:hypothetical protein
LELVVAEIVLPFSDNATEDHGREPAAVNVVQEAP